MSCYAKNRNYSLVGTVANGVEMASRVDPCNHNPNVRSQAHVFASLIASSSSSLIMAAVLMMAPEAFLLPPSFLLLRGAAPEHASGHARLIIWRVHDVARAVGPTCRPGGAQGR